MFLIAFSLSNVYAVPSSFEEVCTHFKVSSQDMSNVYIKTASPSGIELSSIYHQILGDRSDECVLEKKDSSYPFSAFLRNGFVFVASNEVFAELQKAVRIAHSNGALDNYQLQEVFVSKALKNLNSDSFTMFSVPRSAF